MMARDVPKQQCAAEADLLSRPVKLEPDLFDRYAGFAQLTRRGIFVVGGVELSQIKDGQMSKAGDAGVGLVHGDGDADDLGSVRFDEIAEIGEAAARAQNVV